MPEETIANFAVKRLSVLDERGNVAEALMPDLSEAELRRIYEALVLARIFDERALALQREGRLGTYPSILGQEAALVGSALALSPADWSSPLFAKWGSISPSDFQFSKSSSIGPPTAPKRGSSSPRWCGTWRT